MLYEIGLPLRIFFINSMYSHITICLVSLHYVLINLYQRATIYWAILADDRNNNFLHSFRGDTKMQLSFEIFISHWKKRPIFDITLKDNSIHEMPFFAHYIIRNLFIRKYFNCPIRLFKNAYSCFYFCFSFPFPPF